MAYFECPEVSEVEDNTKDEVKKSYQTINQKTKKECDKDPSGQPKVWANLTM